jgi:hypothetical protein
MSQVSLYAAQSQAWSTCGGDFWRENKAFNSMKKSLQ